MRLFLFGASVFYLLGLKLTSHIELKSSFKPEIIESKAFPELKENAQPLEIKPELTKKTLRHQPKQKLFTQRNLRSNHRRATLFHILS